jgi:ketosteroid isomerase-like protein
MDRTRVFLLALSLALSGVPSAFGQMPKMKADLDRLERMGARFSDAYKRGDFQSIGTMYDEHAIAFPPDADMVMGRQAIQDFWKGASDSGVKSLDLTVVGAESSGNYMIETGRALLHVQPAGQPETTQTAKYVVVWKKQKDGSWKIYRDIWNGMGGGAKAMATAPAMAMTPEMAMPPPKASPVTAPKAMTPEMAMPPPKATPHH